MYEKDGICCADNPDEEIPMAEARPLADRMMPVTFQAGGRRLFDTKSPMARCSGPLTMRESSPILKFIWASSPWMTGRSTSRLRRHVWRASLMAGMNAVRPYDICHKSTD